MKRTAIVSWVAAISISAGASTVHAAAIYHELFHGPGGGMGTIGWAYQLDYSGAHTKYSETGTDPWGNSYNSWDIGGPGTSGGQDVGIGSINSNPVAPDADENGYLYLPLGAANASLTYQYEHVIDLAAWTDFVVSWYTDDDTAGSTFRVLVGVAATPTGAPTWYVSAATGTVSTVEMLLTIDTTGTTWHSVTTDYLQGAAVGALPTTGYIVAMGVQTENSVTTNRFDNFLIEASAVPEPAALALLSAGALVAVTRRRAA